MLKGYKIPPKYFRLTKSFHGGLELIVWGAIGFERGLKLVRINETMNSERYKAIL